MAQLIVRNIETSVVAELKRRAARNGRSMEAEHRAILRKALGPGSSQKSLKELLLAMPPVGREFDFTRRRQRPRQVRS